MKHPHTGLLLTALLCLLLIWLQYAEIIRGMGGTQCMDPYRDGIKTYLNASWHARFSPNATDFTGMNYPYAEHLAAATEHSGLALLLRWLMPVLPEAQGYAFGIVHALLLASMLLCAIFLYLILKRLGLPALYSVAAAIGITFLSPQQIRFIPHLGLAPLYVLPAVIYWLLSFHQRKSEEAVPWWKDGAGLRSSLCLALCVVVSALFHFYFLAITVFLMGAFFGFDALFRRSWRHLLRLSPYLTLMIVLPSALMAYWLLALDPVPDRAEYPWGFLELSARWESIFTNLEFPLYKWVDERIIKIERADLEGGAYVGMVAGLFVLVTAIRALIQAFRKRLPQVFPPEHGSFLRPLLAAGIAMAMFACAQPFAIKGMEWLLDYAGPIRQFRSCGRFAWGFYYAINIAAFTGFHLLFSKAKRPALRHSSLVALLALLLAEAYFFNAHHPHTYQKGKLHQAPSLVAGQRFTDLAKLDYSKYQAILPLPYYNIGSDNISMIGGAYAIQESLILASQTGLPVTGAMLTRSSIGQSFRQLQLVSEPYRRPIVFEDYPNQKPLLILSSAYWSPKDSTTFSHLFRESRLLASTERWQLYESELSAFDRRIELRKQDIRQGWAAQKTYAQGSFFSSDSLLNFVYLPFDEEKTVQPPYFGKGGYERPLEADNIVFEGALPNGSPGTACELSFWVFAAGDRLGGVITNLQEFDGQGAKLQEAGFGVSFQAQVFDPNGWVLLSCPFTLQGKGERIRVMVKKEGEKGKTLRLDELIIKPVDTHLYREAGGMLWFDNRHYLIGSETRQK